MKNLSEVSQEIQLHFAEISEKEKVQITKSLLSFFDISSTATARATYYNTKAEQEATTRQIHQTLFNIDRGLYGVMMLLPGLTDYNKQLAVIQLLSHPYDQGLLTLSQEGRLLTRLLDELSVPRRLNVFLELKSKRVNNARTRKLILKNILGTEKLPFWAVKYRTKLAQSLEHAWGKRKASIVASIAAKSESEWTEKEMNILIDTFKKYTGYVQKNKELLEAVSFLFGNEQNVTQPYLVAYVEAKTDLKKGSILPYEVLEGIRSTYHEKRTTKEVLELTKAQLTKSQRLAFQDKAEKADVEVRFRPQDYDSIKLYIYAFKKGLTDEISSALANNAVKVADKMPFKYDKLAILLDNSRSMMGHETQYLRPISVALAVRDVLQVSSKSCRVLFTNEPIVSENNMISCYGDTSLAEGVVELLKDSPEAIFILTDGYENSTAGRLSETLRLIRKVGIDIPVFQITPVMASEAFGIRRLSSHAIILPVNDPKALPVSMIRGLFELDLGKAIQVLFENTYPLLKA